jgi:hypothetical protein
MIPALPGTSQFFPSRAGPTEMVNDPLTPQSPRLFFDLPTRRSTDCGCDSSRRRPTGFRLAGRHEFLQNTAMILMIKESISLVGPLP